jgi:hypothetical protein
MMEKQTTIEIEDETLRLVSLGGPEILAGRAANFQS